MYNGGIEVYRILPGELEFCDLQIKLLEKREPSGNFSFCYVHLKLRKRVFSPNKWSSMLRRLYANCHVRTFHKWSHTNQSPIHIRMSTQLAVAHFHSHRRWQHFVLNYHRQCASVVHSLLLIHWSMFSIVSSCQIVSSRTFSIWNHTHSHILFRIFLLLRCTNSGCQRKWLRCETIRFSKIGALDIGR